MSSRRRMPTRKQCECVLLRGPEGAAFSWQRLDHPPLGDQAIADEDAVGGVIVKCPVDGRAGGSSRLAGNSAPRQRPLPIMEGALF